jgi:CheY-like chemotaxis protein
MTAPMEHAVMVLMNPTLEDTPTPQPPRGTETILVVEDQRIVRRIILRTLQRSGYAVLEADNGLAALAVFAQHGGPIHLLVTDVLMPQMGGPELAERLRAVSPGLRVLYVSAYNEDEGIRDGVFHDRVHYLPKPLSPLVLAQKVRDVLDAAE